jgi:hypothetical protein
MPYSSNGVMGGALTRRSVEFRLRGVGIPRTVPTLEFLAIVGKLEQVR